MSNNEKSWNQIPWVNPLSHRIPHLPQQAQWPHSAAETMLSNLIANNQGLEMNPLFHTFQHAANSNFGTVDLSMSSKNSNIPPLHPAYNLPQPPITPSLAASLNSVIHSTSSHKIGKITPIDTNLLTGQHGRRETNSKSPRSPGPEREMNVRQSNENLVGSSPNRRIVTPDNQTVPPSTASNEELLESTPKSRRKRKPNVTKKHTSDTEVVDEKAENEVLNDLRTDYSEKDMDIENDICSSERISEVCSPTTNSMIEKTIQSPAQMRSPATQSIKSPSCSSPALELANPAAIVLRSFQNQFQDSDECETIDKIAEMVSDLTANKNEYSPKTSKVQAPPQDPPSQSNPPPESQQNPINYSSQEADEVETRLEAMFAESGTKEANSESKELPEPPKEAQENTNNPTVNPTQKGTQESEEPEKMEEETPAPTPSSSNSTSSTKKANTGKGSPKKGPGRKKKQINAKNKGKNKKKGKMNGNVDDDIPKELKSLAQRKEVNGKVKQKVENSVLGPVLQIQKDGSFAVINQATNGDDDGDKSISKIKKPTNLDKSKVIRGMHVSTLSTKYDADTKDMTWMCVFCKLGPHKFELGDLFGPYTISKNDPDYYLSQQDPKDDIFRQSNANKFVKAGESDKVNAQPKKKRKLTVTSPMKSPTAKVNGTNEPDIFMGMTKLDENSYEVWVHEECAVWASGVYIIGTKIIGLESAIWSSTRHICQFCSKNGAVLSCLQRGCNLESHLCCAKQNKWKLDNEFKTYCELHSS